MYKNPLLIKSFLAAAAISAYTAVKFSADGTVTTATASTDLVIGFTDELGITTADVAMGKRVDVVLMGVAEATAGGSITSGQKLTVTSAGAVIPAAPAAGVNAQIAGVAMTSAAADDVFPVLICQSVMNGAGLA